MKSALIMILPDCLQPYEFEQKSIFNFILLEYLLSEENDDEKRMILIDQLSDRTVESWEFIDEFIEQTQYKARLIQLLAMRWSDMWNDIVQDISITYEGNMDILFERFYRTDASRSSETGGSGIGLSVAKAIMEVHNGKIHAESADGKILVITVIL